MALNSTNNDVETFITSVLTSSPSECTVKQLNYDFKQFVGYEIPYNKLEFNSLINYLRSIPNTVRVIGDGPNAIVEGVTKEKSAHIKELVSKQKKSKNSRKRGPLRAPKRAPRFSNNYTTNWVQKQSNYFHNEQSSTSNSSSIIHTTLYNSENPSLDSQIISSDSTNSRSDSACSNQSFNIDHNIPVTIQRNFKELISQFPNGLNCIKLPSEYKKLFKHEIKSDKYGYRSLIEMCLDLSEILVCTQPTLEDCVLYDKSKPIPEIESNLEKEEKLVEENSRDCKESVVLTDLWEINWSLNAALVPLDVLTLGDKVRRFFDFEHIQAKDIKIIRMGEIYDPSKFWIYLKDGQLDRLMAEIQSFFITTKDKYLIPQCLLAEGLYCIGIYLNEFNRAVIVDMLPNQPNHVKVFYIDYGTTYVVNSQHIYYLPKIYAKLPYQSIRAKLADIYPCIKGAPWPLNTTCRFKELAKGDLVANIVNVDKDDYILDILLFDAIRNTVYIQDMLVEEGLALYTDQEPQKGFDDPNITSRVKQLFLFPDFDDIEQGLTPTTNEMEYIYRNDISIEFYLRPYFQINMDEEIEKIQDKHEIFLSSPDHISFDNVVFDSGKLYLKNNSNSNTNEKPRPSLSEEHQIMKLESVSDSGTGSCNRNRIKKLMDINEHCSNKIVENEISKTCKLQLNCDAKEFSPNGNSKKVNLNYSNNLVINKNETKNLNVQEKNVNPIPFNKTSVKSTNMPNFRGFTTTLFQPFSVETTPPISSEIYQSYRMSSQQFKNVSFKPLFEEKKLLSTILKTL